MASKSLNELIVERMKPPPKDEGRIEIWDKILPGFGVRVSASGTKTFVLMYRFGGKQKRLSLGRYHKEDFRLGDARDAARDALEKVKNGIDPGAEPEAEPVAVAGKLTPRSPLSEVLASWILRQVKPNRSDWKEVERATKFDLGTRLGDRPIGTIIREDVFDMIDAIVDRGAPVHANRVLTMTKTFFTWCLERRYVAENPAALIRKQTKEVERERVLELQDLARVWRAAEKMEYPFGPITKLLILTGQRRNEVAGLARAEIDQPEAMWTLPPARAKNDKEHKVPLSAAALAVIEKVPEQGSTLLFSTTGETVVSGWSRSKDRLDRLLMAPEGEEYGPPAPLAHWTLHDIRRSVATGMAALEVPPHVVEKILNHQSGAAIGGPVAAIYNRHPYLAERRAALELWAKTMANGVALAQAAGR